MRSSSLLINSLTSIFYVLNIKLLLRNLGRLIITLNTKVSAMPLWTNEDEEEVVSKDL